MSTESWPITVKAVFLLIFEQIFFWMFNNNQPQSFIIEVTVVITQHSNYLHHYTNTTIYTCWPLTGHNWGLIFLVPRSFPSHIKENSYLFHDSPVGQTPAQWSCPSTFCSILPDLQNVYADDICQTTVIGWIVVLWITTMILDNLLESNCQMTLLTWSSFCFLSIHYKCYM